MPLSFGNWQNDKFLNAGRMQSAKLIFDGEAFFLAATFKFEAAAVKTKNFLGVSRGVDPLAAWAVTDRHGTPWQADIFQESGCAQSNDLKKADSAGTRSAVNVTHP